MQWSHNKLVIAAIRKRDRMEIYGKLTWEQRDKGYKPGWVAWKFKEIYEEWPPWGLVAVGVVPPDNELREFWGIMNDRQWQKKKRERAAMARSHGDACDVAGS